MNRLVVFSVLFLFLTACQRDDFNDGPSAQLSNEEITFTSSVNGISQSRTRADHTIINKGMTNLRSTASSGQYVGLFGAYTGQYTWEDLVTAYTTAYNTFKGGDDSKTVEDFHASAAFETFKATPQGKAYSATQMYNVRATVGDGGTLTYSPLRFWPNNVLTSGPDAGEHEYMTFWGYFPYNPTSSMGVYGIAITDDVQGAGMGMGRVKFTMHPDASQQNDFLISAPVTNCNRDNYVLVRKDNTPTYDPQPVSLKFYHMLAQVRFYAFINGNDKMVYQEETATQDMLDTWNGTAFTDSHLDTEATKKIFRKSDATNDGVPVGIWLEEGFVIKGVTIDATYISEHGEEKPAIKNGLGSWQELKVGDKIPDESQCVRWERSDIWNLSHTSQRPEITYTMELNNIRTSATFYPNYSGGSATIDYTEATTLGSATINHYIMNPYWFAFRNGQRERLNDNYMFGYYENTPVAKQLDATTTMTGYDDIDGWNWEGTDDPLDYLRTRDTDFKEELEDIEDVSKHYNFARGNILLVVPQTLRDDDVPHVVITAHGKTTQGGAAAIDNSAKVTVNLLKMGISWESGFVYCYAFLDELRPGDDKVRGPESIITQFNSNWYTDQW